MKFIEISFQNIKSEIERFLKSEHNKASLLYSPASPFGVILNIIEKLQQNSFLYLKNSLKQLDISNPNALNEKIIRNAAISAGHIPGRNISSSGTIQLVLKTNIELEREIPGLKLTIFNKTNIKNKTNGLDYSLDLGSEKTTYVISSNLQIFLPIIQGKWEQINFTGTGDELQTYQISLTGKKDIENFNVEVFVNGQWWNIKKHIYDLLPNEMSCVVRTGFNGGIDIIFGNNGFGAIPPLSSIIEVKYLVSDGASGNIFRRTVNDWNFQEDPIDGFGNGLEISKIFDIYIWTDINFGANKESILFTKNILPISSNNFVLGLPQQYAYEIKKLGVFSHINAYESYGTVVVVATPNIKLFKNRNSDYFSIDIRAFELDDYEKTKIDKYLRTNGNIQLSRRYRIDSPNLSYYILNVFIIQYSDVLEDSINAQIIDTVSEYFLNLNKIDRIAKSDIVSELSNITGIHSVDIQFVCKKNEDYHREAKIRMDNKATKYSSKYNTDISDYPADPNYISNKVIGLDPVLGDLLFEPDELPIIRGNFYDRNGLYYSDNIDQKGLKSVNIFRRGVIDSKNKNHI